MAKKKKRYPRNVVRSIMAHERLREKYTFSNSIDENCKAKYHDVITNWQYDNYKIMPMKDRKKIYKKVRKEFPKQLNNFENYLRSVGNSAKK